MNDILRPLTADGLVGWDQFNQIWLWEVEGETRRGHIIADVREKICRVCNRGWETTAKGLGDQYYWQTREEWAHASCFVRYLALREYSFWHDALCGVFRFERPAEIPNEYGGAWNTPWYRVTLLDVPRTLKLGHRKRVYHMEIEPEGRYAPPADDTPEAAAKRFAARARTNLSHATKLFEAEEVTKEVGADMVLVHAWTEEKAREYLKHFAQVLGLPPREQR
jgi:hypothetical protein